MFNFDEPVFTWLALALIAAIVEVSTPHFGMLFVAFGALGAAAAAYFAFGLPVQLIVFLVVAGVTLTTLRRRLLARMGGPGIPGRTEKLVGREGVVTADIEAIVGAGRVNVGGEDWAARATAPIAAGTRIKVVGSDGIILEVTRA